MANRSGMALLVDENVPASVATFLADRGHEVRLVRELFPAGTPDPVIAAVAAFYLGIFMNTAAVGVYAVAQRLSEALLRMTNQLHTFLFPAVIHRSVAGRTESQRELMVKASRFQLAIAAR